MGSCSRLYLIVELSADVLYPFVYGALLYLFIRRLLTAVQPAPSWTRFAVMVPVGAAILDLLENALIVALIALYPGRHAGLTNMASLVTAAKLICLAAALGLALFAAARWALSRRARAPG